LRQRSGNQFGQVRAQVDRQSGNPSGQWSANYSRVRRVSSESIC